MTSVSGSILPSDSPLIPPLDLSDPHLSVSKREEVLFKRYSRKSQYQDLVFEFTRDPGLLHQYYEIRKNEYNAVYGRLFSVYNKFFLEGENGHDHDGHIMVVRSGNFCVGGCRINIKTPRKPNLLPMEIEDFRIEKHFPQLKYKQMSYGQVSGFVLLPEFRGGDITMKMFWNGYRKALSLNVDVLFSDTSPIHARLYHIDCAAMGLDAKIHYDIKTPDHDMHRVLLSTIINKSLTHDSFVTSKKTHNTVVEKRIIPSYAPFMSDLVPL